MTKLEFQDKIHTMLEMQEEMNIKVDFDWIKSDYPFTRAIWVECAELMDHYGWKWWKKQERDIDQAKLELIDIWHFMLSHILMLPGDLTDKVEAIISNFNKEKHSMKDKKTDFIECVECLAKKSLINDDSFNSKAIFSCMFSLGMDFDELYCGYVSKNVLNTFRQDYGYKEGLYNKIWDGKEDNEHLVEIMNMIDPNRSYYRERIYFLLKTRYIKYNGNKLK